MKKIVMLLCLIALAFAGRTQNLNITFQGSLAFPNSGTSNIWGFVKNNTEYALVGLTGGPGNNGACAIVDVTVPTNPVLKLTINGPNSTWREIRTWGNYAYITTEAADSTFGVTIANLSYLPDSVPTKQFTLNGIISNVHALHIDNGFLYLYGSNNSITNGGAIILDLANPWNPTLAGSYDLNYIHDGMVKNNMIYAGEIYKGQFTIIDVTNKNTPVVINSQSTPSQFTHNTWLSTDNKTIYTTDETGDAYVAAYDISDPLNIKLLDQYKRIASNGAIPHNTYVLNDSMVTGFQTDFVNTSYYTEGVTIIDAARPANLVEVGNFDTNNLSGGIFDGVWGVYSYLPSGNLILSDMHLGLFVVKPTYVRASYIEGIIKDGQTGLPIQGATVRIMATGKQKISALDGSYKTGVADTGMLNVRINKVGYQTKTVALQFTSGVVNNTDINIFPTGVGIDKNTLENINIYPTLVENLLNIDFIPQNDTKLIICNLLGQEVLNQKLDNVSINKFDLSALSKGAYTVKVIDQNNLSFQTKIIKN